MGGYSTTCSRELIGIYRCLHDTATNARTCPLVGRFHRGSKMVMVNSHETTVNSLVIIFYMALYWRYTVYIYICIRYLYVYFNMFGVANPESIWYIYIYRYWFYLYVTLLKTYIVFRCSWMFFGCFCYTPLIFLERCQNQVDPEWHRFYAWFELPSHASTSCWGDSRSGELLDSHTNGSRIYPPAA